MHDTDEKTKAAIDPEGRQILILPKAAISQPRRRVMRTVVIWLSVVTGGVFLGGAVGGFAGWYIGSLRLRYHPDETVRAAYLAGEWVSEDTVPRAALTFLCGLHGCGVGFLSGLGIMLDKRRRNVGDAAEPAAGHQHSTIVLFD
jgi:hypothetical protein